MSNGICHKMCENRDLCSKAKNAKGYCIIDHTLFSKPLALWPKQYHIGNTFFGDSKHNINAKTVKDFWSNKTHKAKHEEDLGEKYKEAIGRLI